MAENLERGLESLQIWQKAMAFAVEIHQKVLPLLPQEEKWVLGEQIRRSSQSIPANIAEGYGRYYYQEGIRFCYIARGSLDETYSHLVYAKSVGYIPTSLFIEQNTKLHELRMMINGYISYLKKTKRGVNEPGGAQIIHDDLAYYSLDPELPHQDDESLDS
jgi:four helix bundle protein